MDKFIQMDIFFFIASVVGIIILFFAIVLGVYLIVIVRRLNKIVKDFQVFTSHITTQGRDSIDAIRNKIDSISSKFGTAERTIGSILGTIFVKTFRKRGKIKKDASNK